MEGTLDLVVSVDQWIQLEVNGVKNKDITVEDVQWDCSIYQMADSGMQGTDLEVKETDQLERTEQVQCSYPMEVEDEVQVVAHKLSKVNH